MSGAAGPPVMNESIVGELVPDIQDEYMDFEYNCVPAEGRLTYSHEDALVE